MDGQIDRWIGRRVGRQVGRQAGRQTADRQQTDSSNSTLLQLKACEVPVDFLLESTSVILDYTGNSLQLAYIICATKELLARETAEIYLPG